MTTRTAIPAERTRPAAQPAAPARAKRPGLRPGRVASYVVVIVVVACYVGPLAFLANTTLKTPAEFLRDPTGPADSLNVGNYAEAWERGNFAAYVGNSILYTSVAATAGTLLSLMLAFPIARGYIRWARFWYALFVVALFLPLALPAQFQLMLRLGLYDTQLGYILLMTSAIGVGPFLIANYLTAVPRELDEAAAVDGCGYFRYLLTIIVPLIRPVLVTVFLLQAISVWNDIINATIYLADPTLYPVTLGLFTFYGQYGNQWAQLSAATMIVAFPLLVVYGFLQRYFVRGALSGAFKA